MVGVLIALGVGYGAWTLVGDHQHMTGVGVAAEGSMTRRYREVTSAGGGRAVSYYLVVSFRTSEGRVIVTLAGDVVAQSDIQPGRAVALRYDPADPHQVRLAETWELAAAVTESHAVEPAAARG